MSAPGTGPPPRLPPLRFMLAFELGLGVLGLALALVFGLTPWQEIQFSGTVLMLGLLGTLPMLLGLVVLHRAEWRWLAELEQFMDEVVVPWFRPMAWWGLLLVALAAGIGEELLFRGVVQAGLDGLIGTPAALVLASLLFGLVHAVNRAYFVIATVAGLYLGLLYLWTGNLLVPMLVHFLYDWIALHYYLRRRPRRDDSDSDDHSRIIA